MKIKTYELTGAALDWAVAKCEVGAEFISEIDDPHFYSTDWEQAGPIIEREGIEIVRGNNLYFPKGNEQGNYYEPLWIARLSLMDLEQGFKFRGTTPLIAAMRCYVASKLGDEVEIPEELK
jgi:hypothetical protein